jgi:capsule polysaccharide export protein KpsE/RkpR
MIPVANTNLGPRYATQVGLVAALNTNLDDTNMELQDLRDQQDEDRREIKRLKAVIARKRWKKKKKDGLQCHQDPGGQAMGHLDPALRSFGLRC